MEDGQGFRGVGAVGGGTYGGGSVKVMEGKMMEGMAGTEELRRKSYHINKKVYVERFSFNDCLSNKGCCALSTIDYSFLFSHTCCHRIA